MLSDLRNIYVTFDCRAVTPAASPRPSRAVDP